MSDLVDDMTEKPSVGFDLFNELLDDPRFLDFDIGLTGDLPLFNQGVSFQNPKVDTWTLQLDTLSTTFAAFCNNHPSLLEQSYLAPSVGQEFLSKGVMQDVGGQGFISEARTILDSENAVQFGVRPEELSWYRQGSSNNVVNDNGLLKFMFSCIYNRQYMARFSGV